jgi:hypothetical protein
MLVGLYNGDFEYVRVLTPATPLAPRPEGGLCLPVQHLPFPRSSVSDRQHDSQASRLRNVKMRM